MDQNFVKSKSGMAVPESAYGVCLFKFVGDSKYGDGYLADGDDNYLSLEGRVGDREVERKIIEAARYWAGNDISGVPHWMRGHSQIDDDMLDLQKERLDSGLIPDPIEAARIALREGK